MNKFSHYIKRKTGYSWLNHGYTRKELGGMLQCHPNQISEIIRWNVERGYMSEEERQNRIRESKIEGGEMSPLKITYFSGLEQIGGFNKNEYDSFIAGGIKKNPYRDYFSALTYQEQKELKNLREYSRMKNT